jgi:hypothetical protein
MKSCITCAFGDPQPGGTGICRFNPPTCALIPAQNAMTHKPEMQLMPLWPPVILAKDYCGKYEEQLVKVPNGPVIQMGPRRQ